MMGNEILKSFTAMSKKNTISISIIHFSLTSVNLDTDAVTSKVVLVTRSSRTEDNRHFTRSLIGTKFLTNNSDQRQTKKFRENPV